MTIWPPNPDDLRRPAYRSLAEALISAVDAGELRDGDRLPTHRNLAYDLGLSVQTVSRAYDELIRRGVIAGEVGRGTFVKSGRSDTQTPFLPDGRYGELIDFSLLKPVFEPMHLNMMRRALSKLGGDLPASAVSSFRPSGVLRNYTTSALKWLKRCGLDVPSQGLLLTNGNTAAMTVALMTAAGTGDLIVTEELGHHTLRPLSRYIGLRIQGLEIDDEGVVPSAFARACEKSVVKAIYLMPTGLNPRAATMSMERRKELVRLARLHDVLIIENDAWGPLQPNRPEPIAALAPERTLYFTSLTKCIMPGLRYGFLVVPETYQSAAANRHLVTSWMVTPLMAEIGSRWIEDGTSEFLLDWQMKALGERNRKAAAILSSTVFNCSENGMHIWLPMPGSWTEDAFVAHARLNGVALAHGSSFELSDSVNKKGVRICLGAETIETMERGLTVVSRLARSNPEPPLLTL
ncbi:GntR family transcriptional regulator [Notoacmeibacter marinus]|uniref:GntR family transcriptional regulator n=1 Tax=Notoacmeibacter marinus TaxID=1876515 RepID=A0A231V1X8_9HYPH|nr:PLP-dependent aminotransferase family protein [Notoacmeibacter marinus]OXT02192.1 GntR family transcriptional regulator [Notoacmeibacter marinus]